jgi:hypothetical protein
MGWCFEDAHAAALDAFASNKFSSDKGWTSIISAVSKLVTIDGFDSSRASAANDLRKKIEKGRPVMGGASGVFFEAAGVSSSAAANAWAMREDEVNRLGALKLVGHLYLLKKSGGHKVWLVSLPHSFTDWPHDALKGTENAARDKLDDDYEMFDLDQRKHLTNASQEALKWVKKAMIVAGDPKKQANLDLVARWFSDASSTDADVVAAAGKLNEGMKKMAAMLKSGGLIYTDSVTERGTDENKYTEAFVFKAEKMDVVYIERQFFKSGNTLTGLTNWARIVVHEISHRVLNTVDVAYEHQGMAPQKIGAAKSLTNADSWAWFAADCAGALTKAQVTNALAR